MTASLIAQERRSDAARWISELKKTPVDQLGSDLPHQNFADWFAGLVAPNEIGYEVADCHLYNPADGGTELVSCVRAYTKPPHPGWGRWIQLSFIVGSLPRREEPAKDSGAQRVAYIFHRGIESPANPKMARPDRVFSELSDLENIVQGSHVRTTVRSEDAATGRRALPT